MIDTHEFTAAAVVVYVITDNTTETYAIVKPVVFTNTA